MTMYGKIRKIVERFTSIVFCGVVVYGDDFWSGASAGISD